MIKQARMKLWIASGVKKVGSKAADVCREARLSGRSLPGCSFTHTKCTVFVKVL